MAEFQRFIASRAALAESLYILGDLFDYWAGDDDMHDPFHARVIAVLQSLAEHDTQVFFMHGNRDLLIGSAFAQACHATLLHDPTLLDLYGTPTLIAHGDKLCTDDIDYQKFRLMVHDEAFQQNLLAQPLAARKAYIMNLREKSTAAKRVKKSDIMDVNTDAVAELLREYHYPRLIHGHTHRPDRHVHEVDGNRCERWVLSDWDQHPTVLQCDAQGCRSISF